MRRRDVRFHPAQWGGHLARCAAAFAGGAVACAGTVRAATYSYTVPTPEASNTSGTADNWSGGTAAGWDATPVSDDETTLTFNVPTTTGVSRFTANNVANPFQLNVLTIQGTGPAGASATAGLTVQGSTLDLRTNTTSAALPTVNLNANRGATGTPAPVLNVTVNNPLTLTNNTTFQGNGTATQFVFGGAIGGGGNLTKTGTSLMQLNSTGNNYAGSTGVSAGTLRLGANNVLPDNSPVSVSGTGVVDFSGRNETIASLTLTDTGLINNTAATITISGAMTNSSTTTSGSGGAFVLNSGGNLTVNGPATFNAGSTTLLGGGNSGRLNLNGGVSMTGASIRMNVGTGSRIVLGSGVTVNSSAAQSSIVFGTGTPGTTNTLDLNGANRAFAVANGAGAVDFLVAVPVVSVTGVGAVTKTGDGTMSLTNGNNTYTGGTTVTGGSLLASANNALGAGDVTITATSTANTVLDLTTAAVNAGAVADTATLFLNSDTTSTPRFGQVVFGSNTLNEVVAALVVDGATQAAGTYTAGGGGGTIALPNFITGSGSITVVPEPGSAATLIGGALIGLLAARGGRRRLRQHV